MLADFSRHYGLTFNNPELLKLALTHRSYLSVTGGEASESNERLEFLGDSVLGLVTSEHLFRTRPGEHEGQLTKTKSLLVSKAILSRRALAMGLGRFVLMSHSEIESGGRQRLSILADAFESVIGAVYVDLGFEPARAFIDRWLLKAAGEIVADKRHVNYKSHLQEYVQSTFRTHPVYRIRSEIGPDHSKHFMVEVVAGRRVLGEGRGRNKKEAEQAAARQALDGVVDTRPQPAREGRERPEPREWQERREREPREETAVAPEPRTSPEPVHAPLATPESDAMRRGRRRGRRGGRGRRRVEGGMEPGSDLRRTPADESGATEATAGGHAEREPQAERREFQGDRRGPETEGREPLTDRREAPFDRREPRSEPREPRVERPREPRVERPREPRVERSSEPRVERSSEPRVERPREPRVERTREPRVERSREPRVERPREPRVERPREIEPLPPAAFEDEFEEVGRPEGPPGERFMDPFATEEASIAEPAWEEPVRAPAPPASSFRMPRAEETAHGEEPESEEAAGGEGETEGPTGGTAARGPDDPPATERREESSFGRRRGRRNPF